MNFQPFSIQSGTQWGSFQLLVQVRPSTGPRTESRSGEKQRQAMADVLAAEMNSNADRQTVADLAG